VCGLATDYCVKSTVLDSVGAGFQTTLIADACRGVNINPSDSAEAINEMRAAGVSIVESADL
jgi:nicotinamidase/pyrazinamidase